MFIVWGKKSRQSDGGIVADWCEHCGGAKYFQLTHFYSVNHVYYIPLGEGTLAGTSRQCTQCGTTANCDAQFYARALTHEEALGRSFEDILQLTNPRLDEKLHKQTAFQQEISARMQSIPSQFDLSIPTGGNVDQRMLDALNALSTLDIRREEVSGYLEQLRKWDYLTPSER